MDLYKFWIHNELDYFLNFKEYIFSSLKNHEERINKSIQALIIANKDNNLEEKEREEVTISNIKFEKDETEQLMIRSFVVSIFGFLENEVNFLCDEIKKEKKINLSFRDMKGSGIDRSLLYLKKVAEVEFPTDPRLKEKFVNYRTLRNIIVHSNGFPSDEKTKAKVIEISTKMKDFKVNSIGEITYSRKFTDNIIGATQGIIGNIFVIHDQIAGETK